MSNCTSYFKIVTCPLCGAEIKTINMAETCHGEPHYTFDLRSTYVSRFHLIRSLHNCSACGYVFAEAENLPENASEIITTEKYKTCDNIDFGDKFIENFYKYALIRLESDNLQGAFYAFLGGAWVCDDNNNQELSIMFRKKALDLYALIEQKEGRKEGFYLLRADLLRRCGEFNKVIEEYSSFDSTDRDRVMIARIQVMLAKDMDNRCHYFPDYYALVRGSISR